MNRRTLASRLLLAAFSLVAMHPTQATQPNVVIILADDQGWGDLSRHGNTNLATPNLDRLAEQGASFERFYVQPVCSPTRAELLTGRYAPRDGVRGVTDGFERLNPETPTLADAFGAAGYATAAFGKWHNGTQAPYHPLCRGFGEYYGFTSGHWADYFDPLLDHNGALTRGEGYLTDDLTNRAIKFLASDGGRPKFVWLALQHAALADAGPGRVVARPRRSRTRRAWVARRARRPLPHPGGARHGGEHRWNVGRLLAELGRSGATENTIVVYLTDNGPNGHRFNGGMRGIKGSTDEGGVRSPLFVRWPEKIPRGRVIATPSAVIDLAPTIAQLAGVELDRDTPRDGVSLAGLVTGQSESLPERTLFAHWGGRVAARRGGLVLDEKGRLYDLATDPAQQRDIWSERPDTAQRLADEVARWRSEMGIDEPPGRRPLTVGHPSLAATQLPARDARAVGGAEHSNRYHNCTYITGFASPDAAAVWDAQIVAAGRYRAEALYACSESAVGSQVEVRFGSHACAARISEAFNPPLEAARDDRCPRQEGDTKPFARLAIGEVEFPAGEGELTLRPIGLPHGAALDLRMLLLTRID